MIRNRLILRLSALLFMASVASCSFDYSEGAVESERTEEIPQVEVLNVRMVVDRENRLELTADRVATFRERRVQEFEMLSFREFGPDGEIRVEGTADGGTLDLDTEDVELRGTVRFYSRVEEAQLESSYLSWNNADRILEGRPDGVVTIVRDDGSHVEGRGLRLDGRRSRVELTGGLQGEFFTGEDE